MLRRDNGQLVRFSIDGYAIAWLLLFFLVVSSDLDDELMFDPVSSGGLFVSPTGSYFVASIPDWELLRGLFMVYEPTNALLSIPARMEMLGAVCSMQQVHYCLQIVQLLTRCWRFFLRTCTIQGLPLG